MKPSHARGIAPILLATLALGACTLPRPNATPASAARVIAFDAETFTDAHVDVSPDGRTLLFDVLGDLYTVPVAGGDATSLTSGRDWDIHPRFSPDGRRIAFISDRGGGQAGLWTVDAGGGNAAHYVTSGSGWSGPQPAWAPDGSLLDLVGNPPQMALRRLVQPGRSEPFATFPVSPSVYRGTFSADGRYAYHGGAGLRRVDLQSGASIDLGAGVTNGSIVWPRLSRSGDRLAYVTQSYAPATGETCALHVRDLGSGADRTLADVPGCSMSDFVFLPDGAAVVANLSGRLTRIDVGSGERAVIPVRIHVRREVDPPLRQMGRRIADGGEVRARVIRWPTVSPGGSDLVFSAFGKIYAMPVSGDAAQRITAGTDLEYMPAISPDGRWVAYTTAGAGPGHLMVVPLAGGAPRQLTSVPGRYANPVWSPDGTRIAFLSDETDARLGLEQSFGGPMTGRWPLSLQWISVASGGEAHRVLTTSPIAVYSNRFHPVPTFSADGSRLFIARYGQQGQAGEEQAYIASARLDGSDVVSHLRLPEVDEAVVSPDGRHVAIVRQGRLYVSPLPPTTGSAEVPALTLDLAHPIDISLPAHVAWRDRETLVWADANSVHAYRLGDRRRLLADVEVRLPRPVPQGCLALIGARLVTMRANEVIERGTIVVCGGRITALGAADAVAIPAGARRIDAAGTTIIPGLMDTHGHFHRPPSEIWLRQNINYVGNLAYGVTTIYDPSAPTLDVFGQAEMAEAGQMLGPRVFSSGTAILEGEGPASGRVVDSLDDARTLVAAYARYGAGPLKEYANSSRNRRRWLAQAAREQGVSLTTHSDIWPSVLTHVADGYTAIEHDIDTTRPGNAPLQDDVLRFVAESGLVYTRDSLNQRVGAEAQVEDPKLRRLNPEALLRRDLAAAPSEMARGEFAERAQAARTVARVGDLRGRVTISAHGNGVPGLTLHWEMWALVLYGGMDPYAALRAATLNGARKLGLEAELGSLEAGKVADLVVLNANPLQNIRNSTDIRYVIRGGFLYDAATMTRLWPDRRALEPWPWQSDAERRRLAPARAPQLPPAPR